MHKKIELDAQTGEIVLSEMNEFEEAEHLQRIKKAELALQAQLKITETRFASRQAVLDRLGLTEQEAQLLLGS